MVRIGRVLRGTHGSGGVSDQAVFVASDLLDARLVKRCHVARIVPVGGRGWLLRWRRDCVLGDDLGVNGLIAGIGTRSI